MGKGGGGKQLDLEGKKRRRASSVAIDLSKGSQLDSVGGKIVNCWGALKHRRRGEKGTTGMMGGEDKSCLNPTKTKTKRTKPLRFPRLTEGRALDS